MTDMNSMFKLLGQSLSIISDHVPLGIQGDEWNDIYLELCHHSIEALPFKYLCEYPFTNEELYQKWYNRCYAIIGNWTKVMHYQQELLELLQLNGIESVIIKGAAAAMYYPTPQLRAMGDVDFLVKRADFERTAELLEKNGYKLALEKNSHYHHYEYTKGGIVFELHKRLALVRESNEVLNALFEEGITNREIKQLGNFIFPVLPEQLNGLVLLFHIDQHLRIGIGLRQIIDWMMYVNHNGLQQILPLVYSLGMERFMLSVTAMCQKYFGLRTLVSNIEDYPCDELMDYILKKGNFGRKGDKKERVTSIFMTVNSPGRLFKRLQMGGTTRWKALRKHGWLKPFAWIYQVFFIIKEMNGRGIKWKELLLQREEAMKQRELITRLGLNINRMEDVGEF